MCNRATTGEHTGHVCSSDQRVSPCVWETSRSLPFAWVTNGSLSFAWATSRSLPSVQNYRPYIVFSGPMRKYENPFRFTYFSVCGRLSELTYFRFFPVICWSYLRRKISVTLSISIKSYTLSCETTLLMLSCDHIESAKFIVARKASILDSNISSTESDVNTYVVKDRLQLTVRLYGSLISLIKYERFFHVVAESVRLYWYTTLTLPKYLEKKLEGCYTRMVRVVLGKSWKQYPTKQQLYGHLINHPS